MSKFRFVSAAALALSSSFVAGCGDSEGGKGSLRIIADREEFLTDGLLAGEGVVNIRDGWDVTFDHYLVALGEVALRSSSGKQIESEYVTVVDLTAVPAAGEELWVMEDIPAGRWDFFFETPRAGAGTQRHSAVNQELFQRMVDERLTYAIRGTLTQAGGVSCPPRALATIPEGAAPVRQNRTGDDCYENPSVVFDFGVELDTLYGPCEVDHLPGVVITRDVTESVALTIHGDHIFFNGFPEGSEGGVLRLAQWIADADLDLDGVVTEEELHDIPMSSVAEFDDRYSAGGSPLELHDLWDYVQAQLKTQGHYQGEGECAIDGAEDDHGHSHD
jgi:hypothetical protein